MEWKTISKEASNRPFISTKNLKVLGKGASAIIYELPDDKILKAYFKNFSEKMIIEENRLTRAVYEAGIPTMKAYEIVETDDYLGGIYERLYAKDLIQCMREDKGRIEEYVRSFGEFVRKAHQIVLPEDEFPDGRELMLKASENAKVLEITEEEQKMLTAVISRIPVCNTFSHGDCHVGNVMLRDNGLIFIDVGRVTRASPLIDFVSMFSQYRLMSYHGIRDAKVVSPNAVGFTEDERALIWNTYLRYATGMEGEDRLRELEKQINVVTAVRMLQVKHYNKNFFPQEIFNLFMKDIADYYDEGNKPFVEV